MEGHKLEDGGFILLLSHNEMIALCAAVGDISTNKIQKGNTQLKPNHADIGYDPLLLLLPDSDKYMKGEHPDD